MPSDLLRYGLHDIAVMELRKAPRCNYSLSGIIAMARLLYMAQGMPRFCTI